MNHNETVLGAMDLELRPSAHLVQGNRPADDNRNDGETAVKAATERESSIQLKSNLTASTQNGKPS